MNNPWIEIPLPDSNLNVQRVDGTSSIDAFWAVDPMGKYLFLVEGIKEDSSVKLPELKEIRSAVISKHKDGAVQLVLRLEDSANWELFLALCSDLVRALKVNGTEKGLSVIAIRLLKWCKFLRSSGNLLLSSEQIRGLFGELVFLADMLAPKFGWCGAVSAWGGPFGASRDFAFPGNEIEIKSKLSGSGRVVRISSEEQLSSPIGNIALFLTVVTLASASNFEQKGVVSLLGLVRRIRNAVANDTAIAESFEDRLMAIGYVDSSAYDSILFSTENIEMFEVKEDFPRIQTKDLPNGVHHVNYGLDLDSCERFRVSDDFITKEK